jgi:hypothetical protein
MDHALMIVSNLIFHEPFIYLKISQLRYNYILKKM